MSFDIDSFKGTVDSFASLLRQSGEEYVSVRLAPDKWTLKEIVGHLVDSASNNHQRFVRLQESGSLDFPKYDTEGWIKLQKYDSFDWGTLVGLWYSYNKLLLHIISNVSTGCLDNQWKRQDGAVSLEYLIKDYFSHMKIHIDHFERRLSEITVSVK